jgi:hypothetical protein
VLSGNDLASFKSISVFCKCLLSGCPRAKSLAVTNKSIMNLPYIMLLTRDIVLLAVFNTVYFFCSSLSGPLGNWQPPYPLVYKGGRPPRVQPSTVAKRLARHFTFGRSRVLTPVPLDQVWVFFRGFPTPSHRGMSQITDKANPRSVSTSQYLPPSFRTHPHRIHPESSHPCG